MRRCFLSARYPRDVQFIVDRISQISPVYSLAALILPSHLEHDPCATQPNSRITFHIYFTDEAFVTFLSRLNRATLRRTSRDEHLARFGAAKFSRESLGKREPRDRRERSVRANSEALKKTRNDSAEISPGKRRPSVRVSTRRRSKIDGARERSPVIGDLVKLFIGGDTVFTWPGLNKTVNRWNSKNRAENPGRH